MSHLSHVTKGHETYLLLIETQTTWGRIFQPWEGLIRRAVLDQSVNHEVRNKLRKQKACTKWTQVRLQLQHLLATHDENRKTMSITLDTLQMSTEPSPFLITNSLEYTECCRGSTICSWPSAVLTNRYVIIHREHLKGRPSTRPSKVTL